MVYNVYACMFFKFVFHIFDKGSRRVTGAEEYNKEYNKEYITTKNKFSYSFFFSDKSSSPDELYRPYRLGVEK